VHGVDASLVAEWTQVVHITKIAEHDVVHDVQISGLQSLNTYHNKMSHILNMNCVLTLVLLAFLRLPGLCQTSYSFIDAFSPSTAIYMPVKDRGCNLRPRGKSARFASKAESDNSPTTDLALIELLKMRKAVEINPVVSHLSSILPLVMEEKIYTKEGTVLMEKGDKSDGFYFVREGKFVCISDDGVAVKELREGNIFGEVGVFLSESRALTIKSTTPNASTWFVDDKSYKAVAQLKGFNDNDLQPILQGQYPGYIDFLKKNQDLLKKKKTLQSFKTLSEELTSAEKDEVANYLERCTFEAGEDVLLKGSDDTDYMYFVESGSYEILDVNKDLPNQKFFGELSFFLHLPRSATIRASSTLSLFKLSRENLLNVVDETRFETEIVALLADHYRDANLVDKYEAVMEYITIKSRPKRELVSNHSLLATIASGMFLIGIVPCISPGLDKNSVPHILNLNYFGLDLPMTQFTALMFAIIGVTGSFRHRPNTPLLRRYFFDLTTLECIVNYMLQDSNAVAIDEGSRHTFDLLTVNIGSVLFWVVFAASNVWTMKLISEAISAPKRDRLMVPLNDKCHVVHTRVSFNIV